MREDQRNVYVYTWLGIAYRDRMLLTGPHDQLDHISNALRHQYHTLHDGEA